MSSFFTGLCLLILGFGIYQFSHLFDLYQAQDKKGTPWPYLALLITAVALICIGAVMLVIGLL